MGCDIHVVFQTKKDNKWQDIPHKYEENRHYMLFAWLANVRNGYGFAGIYTHDVIKPLSLPRGFPKDFEIQDETYHPSNWDCVAEWRLKYRDREDYPTIWMGDHSHSWFLLDEILTAEVPRCIYRSGIVTKSFYDSWNGDEPTIWSGEIYGPNIYVAEKPSDIDINTTHVRIEWKLNVSKDFKYFLDEISRLRKLHGHETRMVFGFDS